MNRRQELHQRKQRLQAVAALPPNRVCSECPEDDPTWASLLRLPTAVAQANGEDKISMIGVLCCYRCCSFHFQLGKEICTVKNMKMVEEWTNEEIDAMERGGGNEVANAMYEAKLTPDDYDKEEVLDDEDEDATHRQEFVQHKYVELRYFDQNAYETQLRRASQSRQQRTEAEPQPEPLADTYSMYPDTDSDASSSIHEGPVPLAGKALARRCKSFDDNNNNNCNNHHHVHDVDEADRSKDFVKKPTRRRSQSFQEERWTTDDEERESTDDDQRLSYKMPGALGVAPTERRQRRRRSMPLQTRNGNDGGANNSGNGNTKNKNRSSAKERRQRRASIKASLEKEAQQRRTSHNGSICPSNEDLGYGDDHQHQHQHHGNDMDSTRRRSNRRRRESTTNNECPATAAAGRRRASRRKSTPSVIMGTAAVDDDNSVCQANAPKMPTRCVSDDSGTDEHDDEIANDEGDFTDYDAPTINKERSLSPPTSTKAPSRPTRRMSMPVLSSDTDDTETEDEETMASHYKMHMLKTLKTTTRLGDPITISKKQLSPFGATSLGYGYNYNDLQDSMSSIEVEPRQHALNPSSLMLRYQSSPPVTPQPVVEVAPLSEPPPKQPSLFLEPPQGGSELSSDEVFFKGDAVNSATNQRKEKRRSRKNSTTNKDKKNRRQMRRCSTGGAIDKFFMDGGAGNNSEEDGGQGGMKNSNWSPSQTATAASGKGKMKNWSPTEKTMVSRTSTTGNDLLKKHRTLRRGSVGFAASVLSHGRTTAQPLAVDDVVSASLQQTLAASVTKHKAKHHSSSTNTNATGTNVNSKTEATSTTTENLPKIKEKHGSTAHTHGKSKRKSDSTTSSSSKPSKSKTPSESSDSKPSKNNSKSKISAKSVGPGGKGSRAKSPMKGGGHATSSKSSRAKSPVKPKKQSSKEKGLGVDEKGQGTRSKSPVKLKKQPSKEKGVGDVDEKGRGSKRASTSSRAKSPVKPRKQSSKEKDVGRVDENDRSTAESNAMPSDQDLGYGTLDHKGVVPLNQAETVVDLTKDDLGYEDLDDSREENRNIPMPHQHCLCRGGSSSTGVPIATNDLLDSSSRAGRRMSRQAAIEERARSRSRSRAQRRASAAGGGGGGLSDSSSSRRASLRDFRSQSVGGGLSFPANPPRSGPPKPSSRRPSLQSHRSNSVSGGLSFPSNPPRSSASGGGNLLDSGRGTMMIRSDSVSSLCSEVSVNAALLYAGGGCSTCKNNTHLMNGKTETNGTKAGSNSPVSVSVFPSPDDGDDDRNNAGGEGQSPVDGDEGKEDDHDGEADSGDAAGKRQSKKDYWKAKLAEKSKPKKDADVLSSKQRRRRRSSVGLAA